MNASTSAAWSALAIRIFGRGTANHASPSRAAKSANQKPLKVTQNTANNDSPATSAAAEGASVAPTKINAQTLFSGECPVVRIICPQAGQRVKPMNAPTKLSGEDGEWCPQ